VIGYCMGGAVTIAAAARIPEIDAAAPYYGIYMFNNVCFI